MRLARLFRPENYRMLLLRGFPPLAGARGPRPASTPLRPNPPYRRAIKDWQPRIGSARRVVLSFNALSVGR